MNGAHILLNETTYLQRKILKVTKAIEKIVTKFCDIVSQNIAHNKRKLLAQQRNPFRNRNLPSFYCKQCPNNCRFITTSEKNSLLHFKNLCRQGILQYITWNVREIDKRPHFMPCVTYSYYWQQWNEALNLMPFCDPQCDTKP